ncbi:hypothetical protein L596_006098 [Steinernema carpocapsae]|uniref:BUD13 homolog n=1 Tax=Steinernema carpocapsae TaxID=34508 RepID=A0A4U8V135_STECR|nr:hypothetical protein L596_006098 [Steinernema carpocapsae]
MSTSMEEYLKRYMSTDDAQKKKKKKAKKQKNGGGMMQIVEDDAFQSVASTAKHVEYSDEEESEDEVQKAIEEKLERAKKASFKGTFQSVEINPLDESDVRESKLKTVLKLKDQKEGSSKTRPKRDSDDDPSPPRRRRHDSDDDASPHRRRRNDSPDDASPPRRRNRHDSDMDVSPPRRRRHDSASPPRRRRHDSGGNRSPDRRRRRHDSDKDVIPPRKRRNDPEADREPPRWRRDSPEVKRRRESPDRRERIAQGPSKEMPKEVADDGRNAETVYRTKMTGRNRANPELDEKKARESEKQAKLDELYKSKFNKGMKQVREREEKLAEMAELVKEDFTRYADNTKMNEHLKDQLLEDDPMYKKMVGLRRNAKVKTGTAVPIYQGGWPPNRFSIRPGYRWDGVDRSNGFEAKISLQANRKKAEESEYYRIAQELD